jgi:hypothetical protein
MKRFSILSVCIILSLHVSAQESIRLQFNRAGKFKIAQFTDMHWVHRSEASQKTAATIRYVLETEKPDLALLTGDICWRPQSGDALPEVVAIFDAAKVYFAATLGNHDGELETGISREEVFDILARSPYFIGEKGPDEIHGVGNYVLPVWNVRNRVAALLYCFDSNAYSTNPDVYDVYDPVFPDQIEWYRGESKRYTQANGDQPVPSLAFLHIPLPEYAYVAGRESTVGVGRAGGSNVNTGLYASFVDRRDVMGVFAGHIHRSDFIGLEHDVALAFGRVTGASAAGGMTPGARIIELTEGAFAFDTWIRTASGTELNYRYQSKTHADISEEALPAKQVQPKKQGIAYTYYEGSFKSVDEIAAAKKIRQGAMPEFSIAGAAVEDSFAYEFRTYLKIPETGEYHFYTLSDDGAKLFIDGHLLMNIDGNHSILRADKKVLLEAGFHEMHLLYYENVGGEALDVGFYNEKTRKTSRIPSDWFFLPE